MNAATVTTATAIGASHSSHGDDGPGAVLDVPAGTAADARGGAAPLVRRDRADCFFVFTRRESSARRAGGTRLHQLLRLPVVRRRLLGFTVLCQHAAQILVRLCKPRLQPERLPITLLRFTQLSLPGLHHSEIHPPSRVSRIDP